VRSVKRVELLALDVYQRANGRPITMTMVRDRLEQLRSIGVPMRALRRDGRGSESRSGVSDGVDLAAFGGCDAGADDALTAIRRGHTGVAFA
jgi:hypothetical protein